MSEELQYRVDTLFLLLDELLRRHKAGGVDWDFIDQARDEQVTRGGSPHLHGGRKL